MKFTIPFNIYLLNFIYAYKVIFSRKKPSNLLQVNIKKNHFNQ